MLNFGLAAELLFIDKDSIFHGAVSIALLIHQVNSRFASITDSVTLLIYVYNWFSVAIRLDRTTLDSSSFPYRLRNALLI